MSGQLVQKKRRSGNPNPQGNKGKGRKKGVPNKLTQQARQVIKDLLDGNADRLQGWLNAIAETDPKGAIAAFTGLLEFGVPKLQRTELTGEDGKAIKTESKLIIQPVQPKND